MRILILPLIATILFGCAESEAPRVELRIPLLSACVETVNRAKSHYLSTSKEKSYKLDVELMEFDDVHHLYSGPIGMATLVSIGEWQTLDGGEPIEYLQLTANGIFADCAPSNSLSLSFEDNPGMSAKDLASIAKDKGVSVVEMSDSGVTIKFNDGSYVYPF